MGVELPFDLLGCLKNFAGMYSLRPEDMLVLESIANALDAKAKNIHINFKWKDEDYFVEFHNDARGMTEKEFNNYHTVSFSNKEKGKGIGFAGVGAKVYLGSDGGSEIITITRYSKTSKTFASKMYIKDNKILHSTSIKEKGLEAILGQYLRYKFNGTLYKVKLTKENF